MKFEEWLDSIDWRIPDRIVCELIAFGVSLVFVYVVGLIGYAVWYVAYTPGGAVLTGGR